MLGKIRSALADRKNGKSEIPAPKVWNVEGLSKEKMTENFTKNLVNVKGEYVLCDDLSGAVRKIRALFEENEVKKVAVLDRPLSRQVAEQLDGVETVFAPENPEAASAKDLVVMDAGLVSPEYLLADTGSCVFTAPIAFDRLTTYITPISIVIAEMSMLRENMPAVWEEMKSRLAEATTGEFVTVTGPSRTADIEKILILGVHGPKRLIVFLIP